MKAHTHKRHHQLLPGERHVNYEMRQIISIAKNAHHHVSELLYNNII